MIHSAVTSYQWDNVAYYDMTFRQMMAEWPHHNWSKTYTQLWQLTLRDPLVCNNNNWQGGNPTSGHPPVMTTQGEKAKSTNRGMTGVVGFIIDMGHVIMQIMTLTIDALTAGLGLMELTVATKRKQIVVTKDPEVVTKVVIANKE